MGNPSANLNSPTQNAVINAPNTIVSRQRTSSLANALITIASGPATTNPSGRTTRPNATSAARTNSGPRSDQRPRSGLFPATAVATRSKPIAPSSAASPLGRVPGPMLPAVPPGRPRVSQKANPAT